MVIQGTYLKSGLGHFSTCRPKFYAEVEKRTGLRLHPGTINIRCKPEEFSTIPEPALRIEGIDEIDIIEDQYLLLGPCSIQGVQGYRILPVVRPDRKAGHDDEGIVEISLVKTLDLRDGQELEVTFPDGPS
jgi:CTP-dependent riboflavin kinase